MGTLMGKPAPTKARGLPRDAFEMSAPHPCPPLNPAGRDERLAYMKIDPKEYAGSLDVQGDQPGAYKPTWCLLNPDTFSTKETDDAATQPEYLQCFIGISRAEMATGTRKDNIDAAWKHRKPFYLWAHIYQCKKLRGIDTSGTSNPVIEVRMGSFYRQSERKHMTSCPLYYETIVVETNMPPEDDDLSAAPLVQVTAYHKDDNDTLRIIGQVTCRWQDSSFVPIKLSRQQPCLLGDRFLPLRVQCKPNWTVGQAVQRRRRSCTD